MSLSSHKEVLEGVVKTSFISSREALSASWKSVFCHVGQIRVENGILEA